MKLFSHLSEQQPLTITFVALVAAYHKSLHQIAMYVGDRLIDSNNDVPTDPNTGLDPADRDHVLIEADAATVSSPSP